MGTTLAIRFPLGRYHATPWENAVNEGACEWPPSPWRLLRAFVATWYTRWPHLPVPVLESLLDALGDPPSYRTPPTRPGHTRHYLPDLEHQKGNTGSTDLTLDPFLSINPDEELLVHWDADLSAEQRDVLAKLAELLPYLGRSESLCEVRLMETTPVIDETWWRPAITNGSAHVRLLVPTRPVSRIALEATTMDTRKRRRIVPAGTRWVAYGAQAEQHRETVPVTAPVTQVTALRYAVTGPAPLIATHGVLLADLAHRKAGERLERAGVPEAARTRILGSRGAGSDHAHAHWIPLAKPGEKSQAVLSMVVWVPRGLPPEAVAALVSLPEMSGWRGGREIRGFPPIRLLFQAAGTVEQVAPELCGRAQRWWSQTPYLPVRYRKRRESLDEFLAADVFTELRYRRLPPAAVVRDAPEEGMPDRRALGFRRYRMGETMAERRPGLGLRLEFDEPVAGPVLLGQLSHFGYGIFIPEEP